MFLCSDIQKQAFTHNAASEGSDQSYPHCLIRIVAVFVVVVVCFLLFLFCLIVCLLLCCVVYFLFVCCLMFVVVVVFFSLCLKIFVRIKKTRLFKYIAKFHH